MAREQAWLVTREGGEQAWLVIRRAESVERRWVTDQAPSRLVSSAEKVGAGASVRWVFFLCSNVLHTLHVVLPVAY